VLRLYATVFYEIAQRLESLRMESILLRDVAPKVPITGGPEAPFFHKLLREIESKCELHDLKQTAALAAHNADKYPDRLPTPAELQVILDNLSFSFRRELSEEWFVHIPPDRQGYVDQDNLFGEGVTAAPPSAAQDIRDAGNCFAVGLATATIFHLMRGVLGYRHMDHHLRQFGS
jgi:hypothetical protein